MVKARFILLAFFIFGQPQLPQATVHHVQQLFSYPLKWIGLGGEGPAVEAVLVENGTSKPVLESEVTTVVTTVDSVKESIITTTPASNETEPNEIVELESVKTTDNTTLLGSESEQTEVKVNKEVAEKTSEIPRTETTTGSTKEATTVVAEGENPPTTTENIKYKPQFLYNARFAEELNKYYYTSRLW